VSANKRLMSAN
jgi:hypothetical protein